MLTSGQKIPELQLYERGEPFSLESLRGRRYVLFFYPKDDTTGCTAEACAFRDAYTEFVGAGAEVLGVSSDGATSHQAFASKHNLPFRLLTDPRGAARTALGIKKTLGIFPGRATFVVSEDGTILHAFDSQFEPLRHVREALEALRTTPKP